MGRTRTELKQDAKQILHANYWPAVWISIVLLFATASSTAAGGSSQTSNEFGYGHQSEFLSDYGWLFVVLAIAVVVIVAVFILLPLEFGSRSALNHMTDGTRKGRIKAAFASGNYERIVKTGFLRDLYIFLWALLFIIPGIIKTYSYYFVPYLLDDHPELSGTDVLRLSEEMTKGRKWDLFVLDLSFIFWYMLSRVTCGLAGIFYVSPYVFLTQTEAYYDFVDNGLDPLRPAGVVDTESAND